MSSKDSSKAIVLFGILLQRAILHKSHTVKETSVFLEKYLKINTNK